MLQKATGLRDASTPSRGRKPPLHCFAFSGACLIALLCLAIPIAAQQDQRLVYAAAEGSGTATISGWVVNTSNGTLSVIPGSPFSEGFDPHSIAIDPSGKFLYVVNVAQNDVSAFTIDATTGALAPVPNSPFAVGGGTNPVAIVCEPSGGYVYVANGTSNNSDTGKWEGYEFGSVNSYSIDPSTGALIPTTTPSLDLTDTFVSPIALFADPRYFGNRASPVHTLVLGQPVANSDRRSSRAIQPATGARRRIPGDGFVVLHRGAGGRGMHGAFSGTD